MPARTIALISAVILVLTARVVLALWCPGTASLTGQARPRPRPVGLHAVRTDERPHLGVLRRVHPAPQHPRPRPATATGRPPSPGAAHQPPGRPPAPSPERRRPPLPKH